MPEFCNDHSDLVKGVGRLEEGQTHTSNTLKNISDKIDLLTKNGFSRDKHDAVVDAEHKKEMGDRLARREHSWAHTAIVAACSAGGILLAGKAIPVMFKFLGEVFK